jgi:hypothetical protein
MPKLIKKESGEGFVLAFGDYASNLVSHFIGMKPTGQRPFISPAWNHRRRRATVMFVTDFPDDFFENVLERDDPCGAAVLVDHHCKMGAGPTQISKHIRKITALGQLEHGAYQRRHQRGGTLLARYRMNCSHVDSADDVVEILKREIDAKAHADLLNQLKAEL